jgi:hypothetical protein
VRLVDAQGIGAGRFVPAFVLANEGVDLVAKTSGAPW